MTETIGVIGAGAWGTALAMLLADKGHAVTLWMYEKDLAEETTRTRENRVYLPGFTLAPSIHITSSLEAAVREKPMLLSVVPSHTVRPTAALFAPFLAKDAIIISASKGIEIETVMPLSDVFRDVLPREFHSRLCFLSGPSLRARSRTWWPSPRACSRAWATDTTQWRPCLRAASRKCRGWASRWAEAPQRSRSTSRNTLIARSGSSAGFMPSACQS